jgi:hypothetical protein
MWPYNRIPAKELKSKYGFEASKDFLKRLRLASVRFNNGGSGSFVSPNGLALTNNHIASDCLRQLSSETKDYVADGFHAKAQADELKCPTLELNVLMEIEPATGRVNAKVNPEMSAQERQDVQKAATADIEKSCADATGMRCDVVNLYAGGVFDLYKYKKYTDVRLVFSPEFKAAFFGGDPDNFTFPRYCLDMTFFRVYENDKPVRSPEYLRWSKDGAKDGDLVFVSGHPGSTNRLLTEAQLRLERDVRMPFMYDWLNTMAKAMREYGQGGPEPQRRARDELFRFDNSIKAYGGMLGGVRDEGLMQRKAEIEKELRAKIAADPKLKAEYADAWDLIAKAQQVNREIYVEYRLLNGLGIYSRLFSIGQQLYRLGQELPKENAERLPEYQEAGLTSFYQRLYSPAPIYDDVEIVKLAEGLTFMRDRLGKDNPAVKTVLNGREPAVVAKELVNGTKLKDVELRKELGAEQAKKAGQSDDPMIKLAVAIDGQARAVRKRYEDEVEAVENANGGRIARARFAVAGTDVYPDATFTLRLSIGVVKGYQENGKRIAPFTKMEGLYDRATGKEPYELPQSILDAKERVNLATPYNLVSTNDSTGGNSGSPVINRKGEIVGLLFDGNIQTLANDFLYRETQARAVSVDTRAIVETLKNVYGAERVVAEFTAK